MLAIITTSEPPRVRVHWFRACKRKRALWKKSRVDRIVGGDPVNGVDRDGRWFGWDDAVAAGVGFVAGYTIHGATTGNWGLSAIKSGLKGAAVSWLTYNTGGFVTNAAIGAAGTAGVYDGGAAIVGGAIGGAIGGAVGASTGYAWDHTIGGEKGGSIDGFFDAFGDGLGKGAMAGALTSGLFYSMSEGVVNKTAQTVENFGYDHGLYNEAEIYDWYSGLPQRAVNYFANRVNDYRMHFIFREPPPIETPSARGMSFQGSLRSPSPQIFARAFFDPDNEFDITSMHATLDHEFAHEIYNQSWIEGYRLYVDENPMAMQFIRGNRNISLTSYVEYMNYSSHTYGYDYSQSAVQSLERMAKGYHDIFTSTYGGW